jgi:hypothetical protein
VPYIGALTGIERLIGAGQIAFASRVSEKQVVFEKAEVVFLAVRKNLISKENLTFDTMNPLGPGDHRCVEPQTKRLPDDGFVTETETNLRFAAWAEPLQRGQNRDTYND